MLVTIVITFVLTEYIFENGYDQPGYRAEDSRCCIKDNSHLLTTQGTIKTMFPLILVEVKVRWMFAD